MVIIISLDPGDKFGTRDMRVRSSAREEVDSERDVQELI